MKKVVLVGVPGMNDEEVENLEQYIREEGVEEFSFLGKPVLSRDEALEKLKDADILVTWDQRMDDELYKELNLTAFCAASTGFDAADIEAATRNGVIVTNAKDYCVDEVSAHAVMLLLACGRRLYHVTENVKENVWSVKGIGNVKRFADSTVGIFAFGSIARGVAEKLKGFGVRMISYDPYVDEEIMKEYGVQKVDFDTLLVESDYITMHSPLTEDTKGIFSRDAFEKTKDSLVIVNTSRGGVIDQAAMYEMLKNGKIMAAGLDVLLNEPPTEAEKGLMGLSNVIVTPHSAYFSDEAQEQQLRITARDVGRIARGERPVNLRNSV
ncbi:C-terminal binding protein [Gudongella sp. DL1XJH-153]|uniref:C-terminal binding protein n=1 Tax=Gudongella sp. DL1XJH-153 TaxID=3409804 RepID=UPI003BB59C95